MDSIRNICIWERTRLNIKITETQKEKEQAFHLRRIIFVDEQQVPIEEELDKYDDVATHFVGYQKNIPIAASRLRWINNFGKLERICIIKSQRGKSFGTKMVKAMESEIRNRGFTKAKLNAQIYAIDFYQQLGYNVITEAFLDAGIPHVTMVKQLNKTKE